MFVECGDLQGVEKHSEVPGNLFEVDQGHLVRVEQFDHRVDAPFTHAGARGVTMDDDRFAGDVRRKSLRRTREEKGSSLTFGIVQFVDDQRSRALLQGEVRLGTEIEGMALEKDEESERAPHRERLT